MNKLYNSVDNKCMQVKNVACFVNEVEPRITSLDLKYLSLQVLFSVWCHNLSDEVFNQMPQQTIAIVSQNYSHRQYDCPYTHMHSITRVKSKVCNCRCRIPTK